MDLKLLEYRKRREYLILDGGGEQIMIFKLKLITNKKTTQFFPRGAVDKNQPANVGTQPWEDSSSQRAKALWTTSTEQRKDPVQPKIN